ncbi:hypothetical protein ACOQFL_11400 [Actinopolyspora sp. H202]|uniref:hypothetical protein n=1 Tax=Actinopolyspora sp. H202 TaxID=1500456 RepID=UPI003EE573A8
MSEVEPRKSWLPLIRTPRWLPLIRTPLSELIRTPLLPLIRTPASPLIRTPFLPLIRTPVRPLILTPARPLIRTPVRSRLSIPVSEPVPVRITCFEYAVCSCEMNASHGKIRLVRVFPVSMVIVVSSRVRNCSCHGCDQIRKIHTGEI